MPRKILPVNVLLRYGLELTNPTSPRGRVRFVWALGVSLTLAFTFFFILDQIHHDYGSKILTFRYEDIRSEQLPFCHAMHLDLAPIEVNWTFLDLEELDAYAFSEVYWGGQFTPRDCISPDKVAIIVPYRDRKQHLPNFLNHMHRFLMNQRIEYGIYIVEQAGHDYFNRGKLLNVGFAESQLQNRGGWQCFVFHDIDLLPMDQRNLYNCPHPEHPRHLVAAVDGREIGAGHELDGVSAMTLKQFTDVNGFTNAFWGLSGENQDMFYRMKSMGYTIWRSNLSFARYDSLEHEPAPRNKNSRYDWFHLVMDARSAMSRDGLSTLNYTLVRVMPHRLYTHIVVRIGSSPTYYQMLKILKRYHYVNAMKKSDLDHIKEEFAAMF